MFVLRTRSTVRGYGPCLCGDPECQSCHPRGAELTLQERLYEVARASLGGDDADERRDALRLLVYTLREAPVPTACGHVNVQGWTPERHAEYFAAFLPPRANKYGALMCACGATLTGLIGSFTYGLVSGEGFCSSCDWPVRNVHGDPSEGVVAALLYHPDVVAAAIEADK